MAALGNCFTHYRYDYKPMVGVLHPNGMSLRAEDGSTIVVVGEVEGVALPSDSIFADWSEARRFVGPLPFSFSHDARRHSALIVQGSRTDWYPRPVAVQEHRCNFISGLGLGQLRLSSAFMTDRVPYHWKPGLLEPITR
jgi:hypothetical protein